MVASSWSSLRFSRVGGGVFRLGGVPESRLGDVWYRLLSLGCSFVACGCSRYSPGWVWFEFRCSASVAAHLASRCPCEGSAPLVWSRSGRLLSGSAEAVARRWGRPVRCQREVGRRCWA